MRVLAALLIVLCVATVCVSADDHEKIAPNEAKDIATIDSIFNSLISKVRSQAPLLRQAHMKQHGCFLATLTPRAGIPSQYAKGVFAGGPKSGIIRFSNGGGRGFLPTFKPPGGGDLGVDTRGFALKLTGVQGSHSFVKGLENSETQDFTFITSVSAFLDNVSESIGFFKAVKNGALSLAGYLALHPMVAVGLAGMGADGAVSSLNTAKYWSNAPLRLGDTPAKLQLTPCSSNKAPFSLNFADKYRFKLAKTLNSTSLCWSVQAQLYQNDKSTPVESARTSWKSKWVTIADLTIPKQVQFKDWGNPAQESFCRNLMFNPWHSIEEHKPLGGVQRARRAVYESMNAKRMQYQNKPVKDITGLDLLAYPNLK